MTRIERTLKELDDMRQFYFRIRDRNKQVEPSVTSPTVENTPEPSPRESSGISTPVQQPDDESNGY